jgi:DMSO reductase anchor subunit
MRDHWSLVLFTLLIQTAVGGVFCLQVASFAGIRLLNLPHLTYQLYLILFLSLMGLGGAFLHLGKPFSSYHAIRNLNSSWLSREITTVSIFAGTLLFLIGLDQVRPGMTNSRILLIASLTGGMALYAMTRVYRLRTVPSWNHAGTPLAFLSSTLILGGLQCTLLLDLYGWLHAGGSGMLTQDNILKVVFMACGIAGIACKFLAAGLKPTVSSVSGSYLWNQPILQSGGLAMWMIYILINGNSIWQAILLLLTAISLIAGETIHRIQFYRSYKRVGL